MGVARQLKSDVVSLVTTHECDLSYENTMALACVAKTVITLIQESQIANAVEYANTHNLPVFVLSGGSNVILPTRLEACVLLPKFLGYQALNETDEYVWVEVSAGENWHEFVQICLSHGWYGLENLALIPGLVGASPIQNIGAYGVQVSEFIEKVIAYDLQNGNQVVFDNADCCFGYRQSFFKQHPNRYLIGRVLFKLHKDSRRMVTSYGDVLQIASQYAKEHGGELSPQDVFDAVVQIRQSKLPDPQVLANCGSFFQNPIIGQKVYQRLLEQFADMPCYVVDDHHVKVPAGWLIERAGLKSKGVFPILTHQHQALVLTNHQPYVATQHNVDVARRYIIDVVKQQFGIVLVSEPVWINTQATVL